MNIQKLWVNLLNTFSFLIVSIYEAWISVDFIPFLIPNNLVKANITLLNIEEENDQ